MSSEENCFFACCSLLNTRKYKSELFSWLAQSSRDSSYGSQMELNSAESTLLDDTSSDDA